MDAIDKFFEITARGSTIWTEMRGGFATFLTMCYILAVNARLLSESGGPCECSEELRADFACRFYDPVYDECVEEFRRQLVTVTAVSAGIACCLMGFGANLPFALAPGMGLNAYFTYDVVGFRGTGKIPWKTAMAAVFIEGIVFFILTITGLRLRFAKMIPECIKIATTGGIGFFLAHLGLQTAEGIGLVVTDIATGLTLGGCPPANRTYAAYEGLTADAYTCDNDPGTQMTSATTWLGICGVFIIGVLLKRKINGAIIMGVIFCTFISWFKNTKVSYFEDDVYPLGGGTGKGGGEYRWDYFKQVAKVEGMSLTAGKMDFSWDGGNIVLALFTFLYVDLLDTTGTLFAMAKFAGLVDPKTGDFKNSTRAFMVDAVSTSIGACLGTSPVTTYIESASGIEEGGRTGLVAVVVGFFFFISCFFAPLLASVPPWATGPALIVVGSMMMKGLVDIDWNDYGQAIPAFVTIALMPLTYSIAYGIIGGLMVYVAVNGIDFLIDKALEAMGMQAAKPPPSTGTPPTDELNGSDSSVDPKAKTRDISVDPAQQLAPEPQQQQQQGQMVFPTNYATQFPPAYPGMPAIPGPDDMLAQPYATVTGYPQTPVTQQQQQPAMMMMQQPMGLPGVMAQPGPYTPDAAAVFMNSA